MSNDTTPKWTNNAGPRKSKQAVAILSAIPGTRTQTIEVSEPSSWELERLAPEKRAQLEREGSRVVISAMFTRTSAADAIDAKYQALGERFGWTLTNDNLAEVEQAAAECLQECRALRPVNDKRGKCVRCGGASGKGVLCAKCRAEDAERNQEREKGEQAAKAAAAAIEAKRPAWAGAVILAVLEEDKSDIMTDYHGSATKRVVAIGWRKGQREDFKQLRAAAARFPETAHLGPGCDMWTVRLWREKDQGPNVYRNSRLWADEQGNTRRFLTKADAEAAIEAAIAASKAKRDVVPFVPHAFDEDDYLREYGYDELRCDSVEHRDNYSMGHGNWLGRDRHSGWQVVSRIQVPDGAEDGLPADEPSNDPPTAPTGTDGRPVMNLNAAKNGVELRFPGKPSAEVMERMKAAGFRATRDWANDRTKWVWYARQSPETIAVASKLADVDGDPLVEAIAAGSAEASGPLCCTIEPDTNRPPTMAERFSPEAVERGRVNVIAWKLRQAADKLQKDMDKPKPYDGMNPTRKRIQAWDQHAKQRARNERLQAALRTLAGWHESGGWPKWETLAVDRAACGLWQPQEGGKVYDLGQPYLDPNEGQRPVTTECTRAMFDEAVDELRRIRKPFDVEDALRPWALENERIRAVMRWLLLTAAPADPDRERKREIERIERELMQAQIPGYFPTPAPIARQMVEAAEIGDSLYILEPSAGSGAIVDAIREVTDVVPDCIEVNHTLCELLTLKGYKVTRGDFLDLAVTSVDGTRDGYRSMCWDRIVMNPPFERGQDIEHVMHAYKLLAPGGRLVALMSPGGWFRDDRKAAGFREWLATMDPDMDQDATEGRLPAAEYNGEHVQWETLPSGSFKQSGTSVEVRMLVIDKPRVVMTNGVPTFIGEGGSIPTEAELLRDDEFGEPCADCGAEVGEECAPECRTNTDTEPRNDLREFMESVEIIKEGDGTGPGALNGVTIKVLGSAIMERIKQYEPKQQSQPDFGGLEELYGDEDR